MRSAGSVLMLHQRGVRAVRGTFTLGVRYVHTLVGCPFQLRRRNDFGTLCPLLDPADCRSGPLSAPCCWDALCIQV